MITKAVVEQCSGRDGGASGDQYQLNDPRVCQFDSEGSAVQTRRRSCLGLTAAEVDAVRKGYAGASQNGRSLFPRLRTG